MAKSTMGTSTSSSRINLTPTTSAPSPSKVISNTAHGVKMDPRTNNKPGGWAAGYGGGNTAQGMRLETFPKGSVKQANMNPCGPMPRKC